MTLSEVIGKKITKLFQWSETDPYGLEKSQIILELDNALFIEIPWNPVNSVVSSDLLPEKAFTSFYSPKVIGQEICAFISFPEDSMEKGFIELRNNSLISERIIAPTGAGVAGLHIFDSIIELVNTHGNQFIRIPDKIK